MILILPKNKSNNVNHKNDNSNSNERKWPYCLREILLVVCKFYIFCMDIQRVPNSLFLIWRSKGSLIVSIPLVLNPIILGLKTITIQNCDIQSPIYGFQKYRFCEDYTNLFLTKLFWDFFRQTTANFKHFYCRNFQVSVMYWHRAALMQQFLKCWRISWYVILRALSCIEFILLSRRLLWNIRQFNNRAH